MSSTGMNENTSQIENMENIGNKRLPVSEHFGNSPAHIINESQQPNSLFNLQQAGPPREQNQQSSRKASFDEETPRSLNASMSAHVGVTTTSASK